MNIKDNLPFVSIIIPCRNEEKFIGKCLDSIIANDYPKDKLEIFVVDGMSEDKTREVLKEYTQKYPFIKILDNPKKVTPSALNIGIKKAKGEIIIIIGAHTEYTRDYISKIVHWLKKSGADSVGGILITKPGANTLIAKAIPLALSSMFGVGNAYFRTGVKEPRYVDTVPFGAYRREVFDKIGLFDEELVRNQDDELNLRLIKNGGKILLVPDIISYYYARDSLLKLWKLYFQYGYFKPLVALKVGTVLTWRQLIPAIFVGSLFISGILSFFFSPFLWLFFFILCSYLLANLGFSVYLSLKKGIKYLPFLPLCFATLHFSYGIGYLKGIMDFIILKKHKKNKNKIKDIPLTR
ncbi:glycosyltransferase family 2 protein [Thermodesulfovibrio hydrogeniphilus]